VAFVFLFVGKTKEGFIREALDKYVGLISRWVPVEVREIKGSDHTDRERAVEAEGDSLLSRLPQNDYIVALDERGENPDSRHFAERLGGLSGSGRGVTFVVGGPFGLSGRVRGRADYVLSLSKLTFTHEMARLILAEQVYRALTIIKGKTYHY